MKHKNKTIQDFLNLSEKGIKEVATNEKEAMKLRNVVEVALRRNAPDWLKELIEEDDARITKH